MDQMATGEHFTGLGLRMNNNSRIDLSPVRPITIIRNVIIMLMTFIIFSDF